MASDQSKKGYWGAVGGILLTLLATGWGILKYGGVLKTIDKAINENKEARKPQVDRAAAARITESFRKEEEESGKRMYLRDGKQEYRLLYYPTISDVIEGKSAHHAGLRVGDKILRVDGVSVLRESQEDLDHLKTTLAACRMNEVPIVVMRAGQRVTLTVSVSAEGTIGIRYGMEKR